MNIIAVDDEKLPLQVLVDSITEACPEATISSFRDPFEACEYADNYQVDVAFLDIRMVGCTGIEAARKLKKINPNINIVFVTGYEDYQGDAFKLHASGYLLKPVSAEAIKDELNNLRFKVVDEKPKDSRIFAKTFGNFELIVDGKNVNFTRALSKELLAYLIDKQGDRVTRQEISVLLFWDEDYTRKTQDYLSKIFKSLIDSLKAVNADDIIVKDRNSYSVDVSKFDCDAYRYFRGESGAINSFLGEYMSQYVWKDDAVEKFYK